MACFGNETHAVEAKREQLVGAGCQASFGELP